MAFSFEPETAAYLEKFAAEPPRENQSLDELRSSYREGLIAQSPTVDDLTVSDLEIAAPWGAMTARLYTPTAENRPGPALLYVHGGGFAVGDLASHDGLARLLAQASNMHVCTFDYRRAPEAPYPAGREDAVTAYRHLIENAAELAIDPARIAIGGESAGAAHAVAAAIALVGTGTPPAAVMVMSPALDATASGSSYRDYAEGAGRTAAEFAFLWSLYVPDEAMKTDPGVSPLFADLTGLPPLFIYPAAIDPARSDGERFAERAKDAGVAVRLKVREGLIHQYPELTGVSRQCRQAVEDAARELAAALA